MNIIKTNADPNNKKLLYKLTKAAAQRVQDLEKGTTFPVDLYALYEEDKLKKDGSTETQTVLAVVSGGTKFATISQTFINSFMECVDIMGDDKFAIVITGGTSKGGRQYVDCELDCDF